MNHSESPFTSAPPNSYENRRRVCQHDLTVDCISNNDDKINNLDSESNLLSVIPLANVLPLLTDIRSLDAEVETGLNSNDEVKSSNHRKQLERESVNGIERDVAESIASEPTATLTTQMTSHSENILTSSSIKQSFVPHRGSLRRINNPNFICSDNSSILSQKYIDGRKETSSSWPLYVITVNVNAPLRPTSSTLSYDNSKYFDHSNVSKHSDRISREEICDSCDIGNQISDHPRLKLLRQSHSSQIMWSPNEFSKQNQYKIFFDRDQYEFCKKLFTLLDTECKSSIELESIKEFVCSYFPLVQKRDGTMLSAEMRANISSNIKEDKETFVFSPTCDEIWDIVLHSDPDYPNEISPTDTASPRIGIEGWIIFCRLLALVHHQENRRRFSSRHLQQMMRHKQGGLYAGSSLPNGSNGINLNEIVVLVDNPPPGPPESISIEALMQVEFDLGKEKDENTAHFNIQGWPYSPLPLPELDLNLVIVSSLGNKRNSFRNFSCKKTAVVEAFSSSIEGDFILRLNVPHNDESVVVRRSYSDFEWLNKVLKLQKRPGFGHLCGRILPPFPPRQRPSKVLQSSGISRNHQNKVKGRAVAVAKSSVCMISSVAKSFWSNYVSTAGFNSTESSLSKKKNDQNKVHISSKSNYCYWSESSLSNGEHNADLAREITLYLNYLLENPVLSTLFPLNAILKASQSGLESAKQIMQYQTKQMTRYYDDTPWLRKAARTAMSLQFHGILENTGHESASAKIQHASLPKFGSRSLGSFEESENVEEIDAMKIRQSQSSEEGDFEAGVVSVESELASGEVIGGYDMLPSPGPSKEHDVLNAMDTQSAYLQKTQKSKPRYVYAVSPVVDDNITKPYKSHSVVTPTLGTVKVESDIEKLSSIVQTLHQILRKLHQSSITIRAAQYSRNVLQLELLKDLDAWGDSREGTICQNVLVSGVASLGHSNSLNAESNRNISDDIGWQSSLALSAVEATNEVRDAVEASRIASGAKCAALTAAKKAKIVYESLNGSSSSEEINAAQYAASTAQDHAIHATVIEHEADTAKKYAALSLAQDVKCWNNHRKQELLQTCIEFATSQRDASKIAINAWESLLDGLIDSTYLSFGESHFMNFMKVSSDLTQTPNKKDSFELSTDMDSSLQNDKKVDEMDVETNVDLLTLNDEHDWDEQQSYSSKQPHCISNHVASSLMTSTGAFTSYPQLSVHTSSCVSEDSCDDNVYRFIASDIANLDCDHFAFHQDITSSIPSCTSIRTDSFSPVLNDQRIENFSRPIESHNQYSSGMNGDNLTMSMQSLIDGLMGWSDENEVGNHADFPEKESSQSSCGFLFE